MSKQRVAEHEATQDATYVQAILDAASNVAIYSLSLEGIVKTWNRGAEVIFGFTADEIIGQDFRRFYPEEELRKGVVDQEIRGAKAKGIIESEGWRLAKGNRRFYAKASLSVLKDGLGDVVGFVKIVRDDTERKKSEAFSKGVLESAVDIAIYSVSSDGKVLTWNSGSEKIFGYKAEEILGEDFRKFYPKEDLAKGVVEWEISEATSKGGVKNQGWRIAKGGRRFFARASLTPLRDSEGNVEAFVKIVQDDTERTEAEMFTKGILDAASEVAIYSVSAEGKVLTWNTGSEKIFGYTASEIQGQDFRKFYPHEDLDKGVVEWEISEAISKGGVRNQGWRLAKGGRKFYARAALSPLRDSEGNVKAFVKIVQDDTERHNKAASMENLIAQISEASRVVAEITSKISASGTELAASTTESVAAVTQTSATAAEVKQTVEQSSKLAKQILEDAQNVSKISQEGQSATSQTLAGIASIREQMGKIAECMLQLSNQSKLIGDIIATVDDLAQQSNLLAVNASIEAAKAGEQGKGFAVVAQEVKNLSQQSKSATAHVRSILNEILQSTTAATMATDAGRQAVESGHRLASDAGKVIELLSQNIGAAKSATELISVSSQQQLVGMSQMVESIACIKESSTQNMEGATAIDNAAKELKTLGQKLVELTNSGNQNN